MSRVHSQRSKPVIGLVGGIGAGKSLVARILEDLGALVIDSDRLAHDVYAEPEVRDTIRGWWGDSVFLASGDVDRRAVAAIVFEDADVLRRLEELLYPRIELRREAIMAAAEEDARVRAIVIDAPKLFEAGVDRVCDAVVFVEADRLLRVRRVATARGWNEEELTRRERSQRPLDEKRARADFVVANNAGVESLRREVGDVFSSVLASYARHDSPDE